MRSVFLFFKKENEEQLRQLMDGHCTYTLGCWPRQQWIVERNGDPCLYIEPYDDNDIIPCLENRQSISLLKELGEPTQWMINISGRHEGLPELMSLFSVIFAQMEGYAQDDYTDYCWTWPEIESGMKVANHPFFDYLGWHAELHGS